MTAINEMKAAIIPIVGNSDPKSKPITKIAPEKPNKTPTHCFHVTFSFKSGPARALVKIGCRVTIKATMLVGNPTDTE